MKTTVVDRIERSRHWGGDWDSGFVVLVRLVNRQGKAVKELVWQKAGKSWTDRILGYQPFPAELQIVSPETHKWAKPDIEYSGCHSALHKGGRLSRKVIAQYADKINEFFGCPVAAQIDPAKTLILRK